VKPSLVLDEELTRIGQASGRLGYMLIKKRISRTVLSGVVYDLERSVEELKRVLAETDKKP